MLNIRSVLCAVILYAFASYSVFGQEAIPSAGSNAVGNGGSVSYTVGQVFFSTNNGANGSAAQGVQQPFEITVVTGVKEANDISLEIVVYPNPTKDYIKLRIDNYEVDNLFYKLFDFNGKILENKKIEGIETSISMRELASAIYFLKIYDDTRELKVFKIIKN